MQVNTLCRDIAPDEPAITEPIPPAEGGPARPVSRSGQNAPISGADRSAQSSRLKPSAVLIWAMISICIVSGFVPGVAGAQIVAGYDANGNATVDTPYGPALQSMRADALAARTAVESGAKLYRIGTIGKSQTTQAQFWSLENPDTPGYAARYGVPSENVANADFIEIAIIKPGTSFITRPAPGVGVNGGGGIEVVVPGGGVNVLYLWIK